MKFWYRAQTAASSTFSADVSAATTARLTLSPATAWTQRTLCLDPHETQRPARLELAGLGRTVSSKGCLGAAFPVETLAIDDVEVTTDPSCPAK